MDKGAKSVVIVGGGIAGGALGYSLATAGIDVTILERTTEYADRVRGELMQVWGVADAQTLGIDDCLIEAGGLLTPLWRRYNRWTDDLIETAMDQVLVGVPGSMNIGHPVACQALIDTASRAGATVIRGVERVQIETGRPPRVVWRHDGETYEASPDLVIGADGRNSAVRKQAGIERDRQPGISCISGLLIEGLDQIPEGFDVTVSDEDLYLLMFRQTSSRARAYLCTGLSGKHRFTGPRGPQIFLEACATLPYPWAEQLGNGTPAGPCGTVVGDDAWAREPYCEGVVLVGDAAGYGDPILGEGLSMTVRDVRMVRDLILDGATRPKEFVSYGTERLSRVRLYGLLADILAVMVAEDCDNRVARQVKFLELAFDRDSSLGPLFHSVFAGPESIAMDTIDFTLPDQLRVAS